ncbi:MAG: hypothetical protein DHS20C18_03800 [Saprospiraceae bacterium]|nr:MAG: hypothetical protein DHS20C18_03800 [Saprospiraceae bacterium]
MIRNLAICLSIAFTLPLNAQIGFNGTYFMPQAETLSTVNGTDEGFELQANGPAFGINYWFRLKNKRIEFLPELNYSLSKQNLEAQDFDAKIQFFNFYFNTRIYFLDFGGDCDCPTFSKEGPTLEKGLFLQLSPGYSYFKQEYQFGEETPEDADGSSFSLGAGLGFDLGINDFVTITPMGGLRYLPGYTWNFPKSSTSTDEPAASEKKGLMAWYVGLHLGLRFEK